MDKIVFSGAFSSNPEKGFASKVCATISRIDCKSSPGAEAILHT